MLTMLKQNKIKFCKFILNYGRLQKHRIKVYKNLERQGPLPVIHEPVKAEEGDELRQKDVTSLDKDPNIGFELELVPVKTKEMPIT